MAALHIAGDDDTVHRRSNDGIFEVQVSRVEHRLGLFDLSLRDLDLGPRPLVGGGRHIHIILRHKLLSQEHSGAVQLALALSEIGPGFCR